VAGSAQRAIRPDQPMALGAHGVRDSRGHHGNASMAAWRATARWWLLHDEVFALSTKVSQKTLGKVGEKNAHPGGGSTEMW
jgi:hypothetical protein